MHTLVAARALLQSYAADGNVSPILEHLDVLRSVSGLLTTILQGLAAAGAENNVLAVAARSAWPQLLTHALTYADDEPSVYNEGIWGSWAAAALLPNPPAWAEGMYNELTGPPINWGRANSTNRSSGSMASYWQGQGTLRRRTDPARTLAADR